MKPKVLITLGDSLTEGIGCIDVNTIPDNFNPNTDFETLFELYHLNTENFKKGCWPTKLKEKLKYDELINLGLGGASTSGNIKQLLAEYPTEHFDDYEVLVIWLLTDPTRISFYINGFIENQNIGNHRGESPIMEAYISKIKDNDPILEQIFYIKLMEEICGNRNWNLLITYWGPWGEELMKQYKTDKYLSPYYNPIIPPNLYDSKNIKYRSPICDHPNELGYEYMSNMIYNRIEEYHPEYITKSEDKKIL